MPKVSASSGVTRPRGMGRRRRARHAGVDVGVVPHVERAGGAGADGDGRQRAMMASAGCRSPGASNRPVSDVKTTSDITRGFISSTKSPIDGSDAVAAPPTTAPALSPDILPALLGRQRVVPPLLYGGQEGRQSLCCARFSPQSFLPFKPKGAQRRLAGRLRRLVTRAGDARQASRRSGTAATAASTRAWLRPDPTGCCRPEPCARSARASR